METKTVTLQGLLSERRVELTAALGNAPSVVVFTERLNSALTEIQDTFQSSLPLFSARYVSRAFSLLRATLPIVEATDARNYKVDKELATNLPAPALTVAPLFSKGVALSLLAVALVATPHSLAGTVLLAGAVGLLFLELIGFTIAMLQKHRQSYSVALALFGLAPVRPLEEAPQYRVTPELRADAEAVLHTLMTVFGEIDRAVEERREADGAATEEKTLADYPEAIDLFQKLASAAALNDAGRALTAAAAVPSVLLACNIRAQSFNDLDKADWFHFEPAVVPSITARMTDLVALIGPKGVVRPGRVIEPYVTPTPRD